MRSYIALSGALLALLISFLVLTNVPFFSGLYRNLGSFFAEISGRAAKMVDKPIRKMANYYEMYVDLVEAKREVIELRKKVELLSLENQRLKELERENRKLKMILEISESMKERTLVANVVGEDIKSWYKGIIIDKGKESGIAQKMPVICPKGLVGQVVEANRGSSKIMVINDTNSAVDVYVEGKEIRGVAEGTGFSTLKLKYVKKNEDVEIGDTLITSGKDGIFPRGIPVGIVVNVNKKTGGVFSDIAVVPFSDYRLLDYVLVLTR